MFSDPPSQSGDIIFFSPASRKSANISIQRLIRGRVSPYSHVAVAVKQGNAIHAMPKNGVHVSLIRDLLLENKNRFGVYRNVNLSQAELVKLEDSLWYFNRQKYNFRFFFPGRSNASFCSELVAKAYNLISTKVSIKSPSATLPSDVFDHVSKSRAWVDVTGLYQIFFLSDDFDEGHNLASDFVRVIEQQNQNMSVGQQFLIDRINAFYFEQGLPPTSILPSRRYWNINSKHRKIMPFKRR